MSNIKPNPMFIRAAGVATPAQPPTHAVGGFGVWLNHRTLAQVRADEERAALQQRRIMDDRAKRAERRERLGKLCSLCRGKSVDWKVGRCIRCNNTGERNP